MVDGTSSIAVTIERIGRLILASIDAGPAGNRMCAVIGHGQTFTFRQEPSSAFIPEWWRKSDRQRVQR